MGAARRRWHAIAGALLVAVAPLALPTPARAQVAGASWLPPSTLAPPPPGPGARRTEYASASGPAGESIALWGDEYDLRVSVRRADQQQFPAPTTLATDGSFFSNYLCTAPDVAAAPDGDVLAVWPAVNPERRVVVGTRAATTGDWSTLVLQQGFACDLHVAVGADGTAAIVWNDTTSVYATTRPSGSTTWAPVHTVETQQALPGDVSPLVKDTRVAVSSGGDVTVAWGSENGTLAGGMVAYRVRAATLHAGAWSSPTYVQPAGYNTSALHVVAGSTGSTAITWLASDNAHPATAEAVVGSASGWSSPAVLGSGASTTVSSAAAPAGGFTVGWVSASTAQVLATTYTPDGGWAAAVPLPNPDNLNPTSVAALDGGGAPTIAWSGCASSACALHRSVRTSGTWSDPEAIPGASGEPAALSSTPDGLLTVLYEAQDRSVQATAEAYPTLTPTAPPTITGGDYVGMQLTAQPGSWSPAPTAVTYAWKRDGAVIDGATSAGYRPTVADGGHDLSVTVTAHHAGYSSTQVTSAAHPVQLDSTAPKVAATAVPAPFTLAPSVTFSWSVTDTGSGPASSRVRWTRASYGSGFAAWQYPSAWSALTTTKVTMPGLAPGYDYCFSAAATDRSGNASAWTAPTCVARALDDRSVSSRSSGWTLGKASGYYLGTISATQRSGATLSRSGAAVARVGIVATRCPSCGAVGVYVGGTLIGKVSLAAGTTTHRVLLVLPRFSLRTGTVVIRTVDTRPVRIDGLALSRT